MALRSRRTRRSRAFWHRFSVMRSVMKAPRDPRDAERLLAEPELKLYEEDLLPRYRALVEQALPDGTEALMSYVDRVCDIHGELMFSLRNVGGFAWKVEAALAGFFRKH